MLLSFSELDDNHAYCKLQQWLFRTFQLLYTKQKMIPDIAFLLDFSPDGLAIFSIFLRGFAVYLRSQL
jgi:hypothetical protein